MDHLIPHSLKGHLIMMIVLIKVGGNETANGQFSYRRFSHSSEKHLNDVIFQSLSRVFFLP